jgi:transposase
MVCCGGDAWTGKHDAWLRTEALPRLTSRATRLAFDSDYEAVLATRARRDRLDEAIEQMAADCESTPGSPRSCGGWGACAGSAP